MRGGLYGVNTKKNISFGIEYDTMHFILTDKKHCCHDMTTITDQEALCALLRSSRLAQLLHRLYCTSKLWRNTLLMLHDDLPDLLLKLSN